MNTHRLHVTPGDPSAHSRRIEALILAINFDGDEICRHDLDVCEAAVARIPSAQTALVPAAKQSCGHLTCYQVDTWKEHLATFLQRSQVE